MNHEREDGLFGGGALHPKLMAGIVQEFNCIAGNLTKRLELALNNQLKGANHERPLLEALEILERSTRVSELILQLSADRLPGKERVLPEVPLRQALVMQEPELTWANVETTLTVTAPPCWLYPDLLTCAVGNLLGNAVRELGQQQVRRIDLDAQVKEEQLVIAVSDNGRGFAPEQLEQLATPLREFTRPRLVGRHRRHDGFGLGLFLVRWIVQVHGGEAVFENRPEGGAACTLRLPTGVVSMANNWLVHEGPPQYGVQAENAKKGREASGDLQRPGQIAAERKGRS